LPEPITYTFGALGVFRKYLDPAEMIPDAPKSIMSAWVNHCHYLAFPTFHVRISVEHEGQLGAFAEGV